MDDDISEATKETAKSIRPINLTTVHKICSGQVVLNLATAVKELVENALDASATLIEVKLREQGIESIEVSDNGEGVTENNFDGLTAKYHTSKLREFTDLHSVETFGFRGEALSSLCAFSKMVITTRHRSSDYGTRLELDERGSITKKSICARQTGTTVQLTDLFGTLPVRKRELTRNIKREFAKMCQILQGYCLVATGVRIICTNQNEKGSKSVIMTTNGADSVLDNISAVFGSKQIQELLQMVKLDEKMTKSVLEELEQSSSSDITVNAQEVDLTRFKMNGWISSCNHGSGRSTKDRQFIYINSRPCEPKKILKAVNEIYRRFNGSQYPFVYLNVIVQRSDVDVNVTPDKRQLMVNNEHLLLLVLKGCLLKTFGDIPSTFKMQNVAPPTTEENCELSTVPNPKKFMQMLTQWKTTGRTDNSTTYEKTTKRKILTEVESRNMKMRKMQDYLSQYREDTVATVVNDPIDDSYSSPDRQQEFKIEPQVVKIIDTYNGEPVANPAGTKSTTIEQHIGNFGSKNQSPTFVEIKMKCEKSSAPKSSKLNRSPNEQHLETSLKCEKSPAPKSSKLNRSPSEQHLETSFKAVPTEPDESDSDSSSSGCEDDLEKNNEELLFEYDTDSSIEGEQIGFKSQCTNDMFDNVSTSIAEISELMKTEAKKREQIKTNNLDRLKFKAKIEPSKNKLAEEELQTEISKECFSQMEIVGQFNLGFIVVKLNDDLFIVDQHATDEKFNYETLQKETVLYNQKLVVPQQLELTAVSEMILIDNIEVFEKNGFKFQIDCDAPPTKKVQLIAKPMSRNWEFGKDEIDEILFLLQESPNTILRPSKISAMFASRACRKSVMIGTPLSTSDMQRLISQMGKIEQPWNCPHGRPTMRHLINLNMLDGSNDT